MSPMCVFLYMSLPASVDQQAVTVDRVAAIIENTVVTEKELESKAKVSLQGLVDIPNADERSKKRLEILHHTLDDMISDKLIETELAKVRDKLGVSDAEVETQLDQTAKQYGMTRDQLQQALYNQGTTLSEFKQQMRRQMERSRYLSFRTQGKTGFTEKDVLQRCNEVKSEISTDIEVHARHILFKVTPDASDAEVAAAKTRADSAYARLTKGADFATLADEVSADKGSKGGDLGYFRHGDMEPPFEKIAFALHNGEYSHPVRTRYGFHVIKVEDKKVGATRTCDDEQVKTQVQNELYNRELERQLKLWVDELRKKAYVDVKI